MKVALSTEISSPPAFIPIQNRQKIRLPSQKKFIGPKDRVLIIDDFLANGQAVQGLLDIISQAGAVAVGVGIVIEKRFQAGHNLILSKKLPLISLASIDRFENGQVIFSKKEVTSHAN